MTVQRQQIDLASCVTMTHLAARLAAIPSYCPLTLPPCRPTPRRDAPPWDVKLEKLITEAIDKLPADDLLARAAAIARGEFPDGFRYAHHPKTNDLWVFYGGAPILVIDPEMIYGPCQGCPC